MADKEVRELIEAIRSGEHGPEGLTVVTEGKHAKIYFRGQVVHERLESGEMGAPLTLPLTPSDARWYENNVKRLIRSRVLTEDPKKAGQRGLTPEEAAEREAERERRDERQGERQEAVAASSEDAREKQSNTTLLRARAEKIFGTMGVWKPSGIGTHGWRGTIAEVARVSMHWALEQAKPGDATLPSEPRVKEYWRRLFRDEPVVEEGRSFINEFVDHLGRAANPTVAYHDLLRATLGVGETRAPAPAPARAVGPEPETEDEVPVASVREVIAAVGEIGRPVTSAELADAIPDMNPKTRNWAAWKAADMGRIQRLGRGRYAPVDYEPKEGEIQPNGDAAPPEPDDRVPIEIDLEEETHEMSTAEMESVIGPVMERLGEIAQDVQRLQEGRSRNGDAPTLALECLAEMVGQHITVGGGEDGSITDDVLALIDKKRERALALAKRIAELEVSAP